VSDPCPDPFVLTVRLDAAAQARFDALRRAHFPPGRTAVGAHVTVFHALPPGDLTPDAVSRVLADLAPEPSVVTVTGVRSLGRGVAYVLEAPGVAVLRAALSREFAGRLTAQDSQPWRPHVTVQNKVTPADARALLARLSASFVPFDAVALGLVLWRYRGGPWELADEYTFRQRPEER
jgi:2'-5' RNA ligase